MTISSNLLSPETCSLLPSNEEICVVFQRFVNIRTNAFGCCVLFSCLLADIFWIVIGRIMFQHPVLRGLSLSQQFFEFIFPVVILSANICLASYSRLIMQWSGCPFHLSKFSLKNIAHIALNSLVGGLVALSLWWQLRIASNALMRMITASAIYSATSFFTIDNRKIFSTPIINRKYDQHVSQNRPSYFARFQPSSSQIFTASFLTLVPLSFHIFKSTLRLISSFIQETSDLHTSPITIDILVLIQIFIMLILNVFADNTLLQVFEEPVEFELLPELSKKNLPTDTLTATDLLCEAFFIGRRHLLEPVFVDENQRVISSSSILTRPGWQLEVDLQKKCINLAAEKAMERRFNWDSIPSVEPCAILPLWALVARRHAYQTLALHVSNSSGRSLRTQLYDVHGDKVIRACCLTLDLLTLQLQTIAFGIDTGIAQNIFNGADRPPSGGISWLAQSIITPSTPPKKTPMFNIRFIKSVIKAIDDKAASVRKSKQRNVKLSQSYLEEAIWAAQGGSYLVVNAIRERPISMMYRLVPCIIYSLAGLLVGIKAVKRARGGAQWGQNRFALPELGACELEELEKVCRECMRIVVEAYGRDIEWVRFPPVYVVAIRECFRLQY